MKASIKFLVLIAILTSGCERLVVRSFCDTELEYKLRKQKNGYLLDLEIGEVRQGACYSTFVVPRQVVLRQDVASLVEADSIIERERRKFASKRALVAESQKKSP